MDEQQLNELAAKLDLPPEILKTPVLNMWEEHELLMRIPPEAMHRATHHAIQEVNQWWKTQKEYNPEWVVEAECPCGFTPESSQK